LKIIYILDLHCPQVCFRDHGANTMLSLNACCQNSPPFILKFGAHYVPAVGWNMLACMNTGEDRLQHALFVPK